MKKKVNKGGGLPFFEILGGAPLSQKKGGGHKKKGGPLPPSKILGGRGLRSPKKPTKIKKKT